MITWQLAFTESISRSPILTSICSVPDNELWISNERPLKEKLKLGFNKEEHEADLSAGSLEDSR